MLGGVARHAGRAPSCVGVAEDLAKPARGWRLWSRVVDEHPKRRGLTARRNFKTHPIVTNDEEVWSSCGLPNLQGGRGTRDDDFVDGERYAQDPTTQTNLRANVPPLRRVELEVHARADHHPRGLAHVRRQVSLIVEIGKYRFRRRVYFDAVLKMAGE